MSTPVYTLASSDLPPAGTGEAERFASAAPFPHAVIDNFLPHALAQFLSARFPSPDHPVWLDWRRRTGHQYAKQGPGNSSRFDTLDPEFELALHQFNAFRFLLFLEALTGVDKLLPDPHFSGGGMHQILQGGLLDIHTDFNDYTRLDLVRRLNVLIYLNEDWQSGDGGELELWDGPPPEGRAQRIVEPVFNRAVIFRTDKQSFHGHPNPWAGRAGRTRRSLAFYYYTAARDPNARYDAKTDFQGVAFRDPAADLPDR